MNYAILMENDIVSHHAAYGSTHCGESGLFSWSSIQPGLKEDTRNAIAHLHPCDSGPNANDLTDPIRAGDERHG